MLDGPDGGGYGRRMSETPIGSNTPKNLEWLEQGQVVGIEWADGHFSRYTLEYLRKICPCAACLKIHDSPPITFAPKKMFTVLSDQQVNAAKNDAAVKRVEPVGNYAIRFIWADGHADGLYSYDYLRKKCQTGTANG